MFTEKEIQLIQKLFSAIDASSLRSGSLEKEGFLLKFDKGSCPNHLTSLEDEVTFTSAPEVNTEKFQTAEEVVEEDINIECQAPFLGTLHFKNENLSKPKLHVGQKVKKGEVLFSIEAMKLLNDVYAPVTGEIVAILFEHWDLVQYGDVIIQIRASDRDD